MLLNFGTPNKIRFCWNSSAWGWLAPHCGVVQLPVKSTFTEFPLREKSQRQVAAGLQSTEQSSRYLMVKGKTFCIYIWTYESGIVSVWDWAVSRVSPQWQPAEIQCKLPSQKCTEALLSTVLTEIAPGSRCPTIRHLIYYSLCHLSYLMSELQIAWQEFILFFSWLLFKNMLLLFFFFAIIGSIMLQHNSHSSDFSPKKIF